MIPFDNACFDTQVRQYEVRCGNILQNFNSAGLVDGRIVMEVFIVSLNHLVANFKSSSKESILAVANIFSNFAFRISLKAFSDQVGDEETKIEGRILYQEFDTWSPWISSDSPVSRLIPSKMLSFVSHS